MRKKKEYAYTVELYLSGVNFSEVKRGSDINHEQNTKPETIITLEICPTLKSLKIAISEKEIRLVFLFLLLHMLCTYI